MADNKKRHVVSYEKMPLNPELAAAFAEKYQIVMTEEFWANSQFSLARYFGRIKVDKHEYVIVDKRGHDIFECSREAVKSGRDKAIEPGEPADLCRVDFVPIYKKLGREAFFQLLKDHPEIDTPKKAREILKSK